MTPDFEKYFFSERKKIEEALKKYGLPSTTFPPIIHEAMEYSLMAGGKRFRPLLVLLGCEVVGGKREEALPAACALECIHTYSLIHDDLPAMDNADLRRDKPTSHIKFGEDIAILAGDGLLTYAFELLGRHYPSAKGARLTLELALASGSQGMVGGQVLDVKASKPDAEPPSAELVEAIHPRKTGALYRASLKMGAIVGEASDKQMEALETYGKHFGLAFQIIDDILDLTGKNIGKSSTDVENKKLTYPAIYGIEKSQNMARELIEKAKKAVAGLFPEEGTKHLMDLADYSLVRKK